MRNEILGYIFIALSIFLILTIPGYIHDEPDLSEPDQVSSRSNTKTTSNKPTQTSEDGPRSRNGLSQVPNIFQWLLILVGVIALILLISQFRNYQTNRSQVSKRGVKEEQEQVKQLSMARETALKILKESLITKNYTQAFVKAYQELDMNLEYFREVARPKHFTPREYSFSVREPIFKPSVYRFVKIFYRIRYGNQNANELDIRTFIESLNQLFIDEVNELHKKELWQGFSAEQKDYPEFKLPRVFDPTKPKGGKL